MSGYDNSTGGERSNRFIPGEQRQVVDSTRRSVEERREGEDSFENENKRATPDRRESLDRRVMGFQVPCKTSGTIESVEDWLDENCRNDWQVVLQEVDLDQGTKHLMVMFERESDRNVFLDKYLQGKI
ncbi:MAG: hypothetical protein HQ494_01925 [Rhodospirillales bacterium]|nr:hypothetical protein [Rhodospirillales bacterium]